MGIAVVQKQRDPDPLDKLAKAVDIARNVYGVVADTKNFDLVKEKYAAEKTARENDEKGILTGTQRTAMMKDVVPAKEGEKGSFIMRSIGADGKPLQEYVKRYEAPKTVDPLAQEMRHERLEKIKRENAEKESETDTIYGKARTPDDAKKLKEAGELKSKLDRQISELILLRKEKGGEVLNRNVVARAQQLSKDLLLTKKNLESLGVLSQSDRDIVDEIIPSDPTQFNASDLPLIGGLFDDPTLKKLESFKTDTESDFKERLKNRVRPGTETMVADTQEPQNQGLVEIIAPNGKIKMVPPEDVATAIANGGQLKNQAPVAGR
jgi:hypothetical protein